MAQLVEVREEKTLESCVGLLVTEASVLLHGCVCFNDLLGLEDIELLVSSQKLGLQLRPPQDVLKLGGLEQIHGSSEPCEASRCGKLESVLEVLLVVHNQFIKVSLLVRL